ncbi:activating transcription factor 7-interacting protein 2 isoform X2 [Microcaecilia unicolor]|uniref:Activating transcription factor 7-interacting protein 2 isoform X2 n=1 Tax=Microcaecilia unicolor TaxID=1415580 RepID=A0A6P7YSA8_9AMPH|nr:activating transcription factor 7-interacting protein 2 isoform X2 [Microcaecilia unicolor]
MEISNGTAKKILRARKTMNQSCRQQVEALNKIKDIWEKEKTSKETYNDAQSVLFKKSVDIICKNNYSAQENSVSEISKTSLPCKEKDVPCKEKDVPCKEKDVPCKEKEVPCKEKEVCSSKLNVSVDVDSGGNGCSLKKDRICFADHQSKAQDPLKEKSTQKKENSASSKLFKDSLPQNIVVNTSVDKAELLVSKHPPQQNTFLPVFQNKSTESASAHNCENEAVNRMIPVLEKVSPRLNPNIENEDLTIPILEKFTMVEDISPAQIIDDALTDNCDVKHMDTSVSSVTRTLHSEDNTSGDAGVTQRKRIHSGNDDDTKRKHQKMGDEKQVNSHVESEATKVCLEKVRHLIEQQICVFFRSAFDQRLEELIERVKQIQCRKKHEELAAKCLRKLHKIENRVNLLATQKEDLHSPKLSLSKSDSCKAALSNRNSCLNNQSDKQTTGTSISSSITANQTSTVNPHKEFPKIMPSSQIGDSSKGPVILCDSDSDSCKSVSEDAQLNSTRAILSEVSKNSGEQVSKVSSTSGEAKIQSGNTVPKADNLEQTLLVVDLTEDEDQQKSEKGVPANKQRVGMGNGSVTILDTDLESVSINTSSTPLNSKKTSCPDPVLNTLPPQKYDLQVTEVINPRGIALSWNVAKINPRCAAVQFYYLYMYQETSKTSTTKWIKVGEVKAMPLPMACTLTKFASGNKCHFTMRAKDIYGRFGPLSEIQSTTLHLSDSPENT